ncbi:acyl-CoA carboxylase subunit beta [Prescottella agglutinans]|uniref:Acetyl-CoA carboxylase carboxyltransferase component n=1 Tax=Prescottella agglutinans TaxID=1644129 RepID=A0ABT6MED4_9NOCA|nr:carboxyl transferase domain-containing protein [Prescottella agglutinans]MDH6282672.1 acetyl-CoA carboxylase carboxyltransferase component [Prescottella agglutinans]
MTVTNSERVMQAHAATTDLARATAVAKQNMRGKCTARERIRMLTGTDSFVEFGALVTPGLDERPSGPGATGDGVVTGIGYIDGRPAVIAAFDFTVMGGSNGAVGMLKIERCAQVALHDRIPLILLCDGGGHRIQEGLDSRASAFGSPMLARLVDLSGLVPTVAVMMGPGFGLATNLAALCDLVVMVRGTSTLGMSSAPFVKAATGEELSNEQIGGADIQSKNGVVDLAVDDEIEAIDAVRAYLSYFPATADGEIPVGSGRPSEIDISSLIPDSMRRAYDVKTVIEAIADQDSVLELRPARAQNIVTSLARIGGRAVGVVANQPLHLGGALDSAACEKAAHFIAVCDAFGIPLLIMIDLPGFLIGSAAESSQLGRRSGRLVYELAQATVPRFVVVMRKAYGAAYIAMGGGRSIDADVVVAWPTAEICAMPIESAVDIAYRRDIDAADDPSLHRDHLITRFRAGIDPLWAASGFGIDDVIMPAQTRERLVEALRRCTQRRDSRIPGKRRSISPI